MKQITIERLSTADAKNQTGQRVQRNWTDLPYVFPPDYMEFIELFNGYCGTLGTSYVDWRPFEELLEMNEGYQVEKWWPGLTMIGTDGGGEGYAINKNNEYVQFPLIGDGIDVIAGNFDELVDYVYTYDWGDDTTLE